jgi:hypothetical protein
MPFLGDVPSRHAMGLMGGARPHHANTLHTYPSITAVALHARYKKPSSPPPLRYCAKPFA